MKTKWTAAMLALTIAAGSAAAESWTFFDHKKETKTEAVQTYTLIGGTLSVTEYGFEDTLGYYRAGQTAVGSASDVYASGDNAEYALLRVEITNESALSVDFLEDCEVRVTADGSTYGGWSFQRNPDNEAASDSAYGLDSGCQNTRWIINEQDVFEIAPGETGYYVMGCTLPNDVAYNSSSAEMTISIAGQEIRFDLRGTREAPQLGIEPIATAAPTPVPMPIATAAPTAAPVFKAANPSIGGYDGGWNVQVSSYRINNDRSIVVDGYCAVDGNLNTAWNTNRRTTNEWINIATANGSAYEVAGIRVANGYWKNSSVYRKNARMRSIDVYCDGAYTASFTLTDSVDYQTFRFAQPVLCASVKIVIRDGYSGSSYNDCAVTELDLIGPMGQTLNREAMNDWGRAVKQLKTEMSYGVALAKGSKGFDVVGLQLLLRDGFGVLNGTVDGDFGSGTQAAVAALANQMSQALGSSARPMSYGIVDSAYWNNMLDFMDLYSADEPME